MKLFALVAGMLLGLNAMACDVCGAVNSALGLGTVAAGNRHSIGCTYQYRSYKSHHPGIFNEPEVSSAERFQRLDLNGTIRLASRWQLKVSVPLVYNEQTKEAVHLLRQGFADPMITGHYFVVNRMDTTGNKVIRLSAGGGVKMPFASFPKPDNELLLLYPGTGTWDGMLQSSFFLRKNKWALIQENNLVLRGSNKYDYQPGNLFSATLYGMRRFSNWSVFGGFQYAWNGIDYQDRKAINSSPSQGNILSATLGGTIQWGNVMVQANYHLPIAQDLGNGYVHQQTGFTAGVYYLFN
ncbi:MAG TPA: hypothetical protein VK151_06350 [Fluviicola sp.]|nr:hypothetical protein [Fluviicola sp.]